MRRAHRINRCCQRDFVRSVPALPWQAYTFDFVRSFGACTLGIARAILLLKYGNLAPVGGSFAGRLATLIQRETQILVAHAAGPVPLAGVGGGRERL
jgi:hypothetical protein